MTLNEYQKLAFQTAKYPNKGTGDMLALCYTILGLNGEAGETAEKIKKRIRGDAESSEFIDQIKKELGDTLWYLAAICTELNLNLGEIANNNIVKLFDRQQRGIIKGSGDNR